MTKLNDFQTIVFYSLCEYRVKKYTTCKDGKTCDVTLVIINSKIADTVKHCTKKHGLNYQDAVSDAIFVIMDTMPKFNPRDGVTWEDIAERRSAKAFNQLVKYLRENIKKYYEERNLVMQTSRTFVDESGNKRKVYVNVKMPESSVDKEITNVEGTTSLLQLLADDAGLWDSKSEEHANDFLEWYELNKERVLSQKQLELLSTLSKFGYSVDTKCTRELQEHTNITPANVPNRLERIKERLLRAYQQDSQLMNPTYQESMIAKQLGLLRTLNSIANDKKDVDTINERLSKALISNIDSSIIEAVLDELPYDDQLEVTFSYQHKTIIISETLYKIVIIIENKITELEAALSRIAEDKLAKAKEEGVKFPKNELPKYLQGLAPHIKTVYVNLDAKGEWHRED